MADRPARADKSGKFQTETEELIEGFQKAVKAFRDRLPNHFRTIQQWPFERASAEIIRELRKNA